MFNYDFLSDARVMAFGNKRRKFEDYKEMIESLMPDSEVKRHKSTKIVTLLDPSLEVPLNPRKEVDSRYSGYEVWKSGCIQFNHSSQIGLLRLVVKQADKWRNEKQFIDGK